jgi:hypothetical protein
LPIVLVEIVDRTIVTTKRKSFPEIKDCITMNLFAKTAPQQLMIATSLIIGLNAAAPTVAAPSSKQIWSCQAESATRKYVVDQLDRDGTGFDMAIFSKDKGDHRDYIGTTTITASQTNPEYIGKGAADSSNITVNAFGRTVAFNVNDSGAGSATGRCSVNWQMADGQTRRLVRQCLANAANQIPDGNIAEVTRSACTNDPTKTIASLPPIGQGAEIKPAPVEKMIPTGWKVEQQIPGDLNGDRRSDTALKLIQTTTGQRALLVLLAKNDGWEQLAFAPKLLLCQSCGGMLGSPTGGNIKIMIDNGVLVVDQLRGSRDAINTVHRFRIDRASQKLVCIGEDINPFDRANGNKLTDSRNFLTGKRIVDETIVSNSEGFKPGHRTQEFQVSKALRAIESIDIEVASQSSPGLVPLDKPLK